MDQRIASLKTEFEKGQEELNRLEQRRQEVYATMLRISGAIQVLEELRQADRTQSELPNDAAQSAAA